MVDISLMSINVSLPEEVTHEGKMIYSGINKSPVHGNIYLAKLNLSGDGQADLRVHGGPDKAICVYSYEHFSFWETVLHAKLNPGAFGENLTIKGFTEDDFFIGDIFELGEAIVQVTQPRQPCFKLAQKLNNPNLPIMVQYTGYTGFYFRVLKEGNVNVDHSLKLVERKTDSVSISFANKIKYKQKTNVEGINKLLSIPELSQDWRKA